MDEKQELELLHQLQALVRKQNEIAEEREDGMLGVLVGDDDLALEYQRCQVMIYKINRMLGLCDYLDFAFSDSATEALNGCTM